uniref:Uncharacterized protein n=1 Tax=Spongospora subterranea TaxID=70186 RepID=A0A0H5R2W3_9EUKA|eukprot:CRZ08543.1 hypothetical protein [Spongospora subterranea]
MSAAAANDTTKTRPNTCCSKVASHCSQSAVIPLHCRHILSDSVRFPLTQSGALGRRPVPRCPNRQILEPAALCPLMSAADPDGDMDRALDAILNLDEEYANMGHVQGVNSLITTAYEQGQELARKSGFEIGFYNGFLKAFINMKGADLNTGSK